MSIRNTANTPEVGRTRSPRIPRLFQIGFNFLATDFLNALFLENGYRVANWEKGALARELYYAKHADWKPFLGRETTVLFCNLECVHEPSAPLLEAYKEYRYLARAFPNALFLLDHGDRDAWLAKRVSHQDGKYLESYALHYGVPEHEVIERWATGWDTHYSRCRQYFGNSARLIDFDIQTQTKEDLQTKLSKWYRLDTLPVVELAQPTTLQPQPRLGKTKVAATPSLARHSPIRGAQARLVRSLVEFALMDSTSDGQKGHPINPSQEFGVWDGQTTLQRKDGKRFRLARWQIGKRAEAALVPASYSDKYTRTQGVINDLLRVGASRRIAIDMQDARDGDAPKPLPSDAKHLLTYNRKNGSAGLILWPLPGYHSFGNEQFFKEAPPDPIPYEHKRNVVAWRGNLTGPSKRSLMAFDMDVRPSHAILSDLADGTRDAAKTVAHLNAISRYAFVTRFAARPGFDVGFVLSDRLRSLAKDPLIAPYVGAYEGPDFFYKHKYMVCLSGHDGPSNFPLALASNCTVFKEHDGWEFFYSGVFRPWEHFIPIAAGGADLEEKLEWAHSNEKRCVEMIMNRRENTLLLGSPRLRSVQNRLLAEALSP